MDHQHSLDHDQLNEMNEHQQNQKLASSELGDLFSHYIGGSLFICIFEHHLKVVEDKELKELMEYTLAAGKKNLKCLENIYSKENIPIPHGFGQKDVNSEAPKLFGDQFMGFYIAETTRAALQVFATALSTSFRQDIIDFHAQCLEDTKMIYNKCIHFLLSKGVDVSPPPIPYPKKVDFVEKDSFIAALRGKTRPLTALEIKHLQININTNTLGKTLMLAFSQVASSEELREYFRKGAQLAQEQINELGKFLTNDNLPAPKLMDAYITDSTVSPFSDKLLLYHAVLANALGLQYYGTAVSRIMRHDLHLQFGTLTASIGKFSNKGINMMIEKGWFEEPPTAADREKLSKNT